MSKIALLDLRIPRSKTALMQHLQNLLSGAECPQWCGGEIRNERIWKFLLRMEERYPALTCSPRTRSYRRSHRYAAMHMVLWPVMSPSATSSADAPGLQRIHAALNPVPPDSWQWWILSSDGRGGLCDPASEDARVAHNAIDAEHHMVYQDYVLLQRHKPVPVQIREPGGALRTIWRGTSTWTWMLRSAVLRELKAEISMRCRAGHDLGKLLALQRNRPLFAGVRTQVIELHRYALDEARRVCPRLADELIPMRELKAKHLPAMVRLPVYDAPPMRIRDVLALGTSRAPKE